MLIWVLVLGLILVFFVLSFPKKEIFVEISSQARPYQKALELAAERTKSFESGRSFERPQEENTVNLYQSGVPKNTFVYDEQHPGPALGREMGVPVPQGALADYSTFRNRKWISSREPAFRTAYPEYARPGALAVPPPVMGDFPPMNRPFSNDFFKPYGPNIPPQFPSFVGNVSAFAPLPEVITPWEKVGLLISAEKTDHPQLLNLYRRPIAPSQELWEYNVQDLNGFVIRLDQRRFIEDGDVISHIPGKPGEWKVNMPADNKYVWV
jgi:hypothetical protein